MRLGAAHHTLAPPVRDDGLRGFGARPIVAIERPFRELTIELRAIGSELRLQSVEHFLGKAIWIGRGLQHQRGHCADQNGLRHTALAMPSQIMRHLAAASGMADMNGILQIKMRRQPRKIVCIVIHIVAGTCLGGSAVAAAVMGYDAIALLEEEQHLRVPVIGRQRPAMTENDGLTFAPVLVKNLRAVLGCDRTHVLYSSMIASDADDPAPTFQWPDGDRRLPIRIRFRSHFIYARQYSISSHSGCGCLDRAHRPSSSHRRRARPDRRRKLDYRRLPCVQLMMIPSPVALLVGPTDAIASTRL